MNWMDLETRTCPSCGREFAVDVGRRGCKATYCSETCRREASREYERKHRKRDRTAERRRRRAEPAASVPPHDCRVRRRIAVGEFGEPIAIEERF